ncbi:MAG TPA: AsmA family protein [Burkholderiales bacterium]|nr:AsmA family protein [Burkholderiales bacterium]
MKWLKRIGLPVAALLLLLAIVPFFISVNDYIPQIEKAASERLKDPVKIESLRLTLLPLPHLTVGGVTVGKADLTTGKVTVTPDLWSLLGSPKVIRKIDIDKLILTQAGVEKIPQWTRSDKPDEPPAVRVESIMLDDAVVKLEKTTVGPFDARLRMSSAGGLEEALVEYRDGKLKAIITPQGKDKYSIDADAKSWKLPAATPIVFDELSIKGAATTGEANLTDIRAKLYGGTVTGRATVGYQKGMQLKGNLDVNQLELKSLVPLLSPGTNVSGRLNAKPVFSASAPSADRLMNALRLETPFRVQNGVLYGVDIAKAASSFAGKDGAKGGETRFDQLSGHLVMDRGTYRFTQLNIASGSLSADGAVTISPRQELSGKVNAKVQAASLASATVPLNVAGTVQSPLLYPTGGSIAGAAVGTAIAGPLGTGIGAKVGQWAEGLFGGNEAKKK